jgi:hypothetical protein
VEREKGGCVGVLRGAGDDVVSEFTVAWSIDLGTRD